MRNSLLIYLGSLCCLLTIACKSNKLMETSTSYILELSDEKAVDMLDVTYQDYNISNIKRISKSQYQYHASFICRDKDCQALELLLKKDKSIINYMVDESKIDPVITTKGSKAHRTGPIGSQGGQ